MDKGDRQERELEGELDQLYRKVAGMAPAEGAAKGKKTGVDRKGSAEGASPLAFPAVGGSLQGRRLTPFRIAPVAWAYMGGAFLLAMVALFLLAPVEHPPTVASRDSVAPLTQHWPTEAGTILKDKEGQPPPGTIIVPKEEAAKAVALLKEKVEQSHPLPLPPEAIIPPKQEAADGNGRGDAGPQAVKPPSVGRQGNYAVQIRAFPEDQEQKAIAFLDKIREKYPDAAVETVAIARHGVWHRILIGSFASDGEADEYRQSRGVARDYPNSFVQKRSVAFRK